MKTLFLAFALVLGFASLAVSFPSQVPAATLTGDDIAQSQVARAGP